MAEPAAASPNAQEPVAVDPNVNEPVAVDPNVEDDVDSLFGSDGLSSTASVTSSILRYRTINGRTFHAERGNAHYWSPNDDTQNDTQDIMHHAKVVALDGKLFLSPLEKGKINKVLDVGTGTGMWAIDFADEFPNAQVIGTDISPIQPTWIPPNLRFEIEDCTQDWTFGENVFDFIHMAWLYGSIPDWERLYEQAFAALKPGAWLESNEACPRITSDDNTVVPGMAAHQWGDFYFKLGDKLGRTFHVLDEDLQVKYMTKAGFVDLRVRDFKFPFGKWPLDPKLKRLAAYVTAGMADLEGYVGLAANMTDGWSREETIVYCAQLRKEMGDPKVHSYARQRIVYGRKPE